MVMEDNFQDIFDVLSKAPTLNLPSIKEIFLKIEYLNYDKLETVYDVQEPSLPFAESEVFHANISDWRRLTAEQDGCKTVYEVAFDITGSGFHFRPGDTIGVVPHNIPSEVDFILSRLDLVAQADVPYILTVDRNQKGAKIPPHIPVKSSLKNVLQYCVDIRSVLKKLFILALSRYTKDEDERKVLEYLCSKEGSSTYTTHILNKNICILDLFSLFKSCKPPVEVILANLPRLLPRPYSIVNSGLKDPSVLKICFSVMDIGNNRKGLATGWLEDLLLRKKSNLEDSLRNLTIDNENNKICNTKVPIYIRKNMSKFSMPDDWKTALLLIGPGTGVAPYIGFLEELEVLKKTHPEAEFGESWLFFGCRNPELDFIYEQELKDFVQNGILNKLSTAFSRVEGTTIKYVQDSLTQDGKEIVKLIKNGATVYVCGDLKTTAQQIKYVLEECLVKYGDFTQDDARKFICDMQKENRYLVDVWS